MCVCSSVSCAFVHLYIFVCIDWLDISLCITWMILFVWLMFGLLDRWNVYVIRLSVNQRSVINEIWVHAHYFFKLKFITMVTWKTKPVLRLCANMCVYSCAFECVHIHECVTTFDISLIFTHSCTCTHSTINILLFYSHLFVLLIVRFQKLWAKQWWMQWYLYPITR